MPLLSARTRVEGTLLIKQPGLGIRSGASLQSLRVQYNNHLRSRSDADDCAADSLEYRAINSKHPKHIIFLPLCTGAIILILLTKQSAMQLLQPHYIFLPPVTRIVSPVTYENNGLATANTALAASSGLAGRRSGMSGYSSAFPPFAPPPPWRFCNCFPGIPSATFVPSDVVTYAPSSLAAVRRVLTKPKATVLERTLKAGPHSLAMVLVRPTVPALATA